MMRHCVTYAPLREEKWHDGSCSSHSVDVDPSELAVVEPECDGAWRCVGMAANDRYVFWTWERIDVFCAAASPPKQLLVETPAPALLH